MASEVWRLELCGRDIASAETNALGLAVRLFDFPALVMRAEGGVCGKQVVFKLSREALIARLAQEPLHVSLLDLAGQTPAVLGTALINMAALAHGSGVQGGILTFHSLEHEQVGQCSLFLQLTNISLQQLETLSLHRGKTVLTSSTLNNQIAQLRTEQEAERIKREAERQRLLAEKEAKVKELLAAAQQPPKSTNSAVSTSLAVDSHQPQPLFFHRDPEVELEEREEAEQRQESLILSRRAAALLCNDQEDNDMALSRVEHQIPKPDVQAVVDNEEDDAKKKTQKEEETPVPSETRKEAKASRPVDAHAQREKKKKKKKIFKPDINANKRTKPRTAEKNSNKPIRSAKQEKRLAAMVERARARQHAKQQSLPRGDKKTTPRSTVSENVDPVAARAAQRAADRIAKRQAAQERMEMLGILNREEVDALAVQKMQIYAKEGGSVDGWFTSASKARVFTGEEPGLQRGDGYLDQPHVTELDDVNAQPTMIESVMPQEPEYDAEARMRELAKLAAAISDLRDSEWGSYIEANDVDQL